MKDERIVELFWNRDESALGETEIKYSKLCHYIAGNFLSSREDREECINDALLSLWNNIPPERPKSLSAYLAAAVRSRAIDKSRSNNAWKRGSEVQIVGEEYLSFLEDETDIASGYESQRIGETISAFLRRSAKKERKVFVMRYWLDCSVKQISAETGFSESKIKSMLKRMRDKLRAELEKEGIIV